VDLNLQSDQWIDDLSDSIQAHEARKRRFSWLASEQKPVKFTEGNNPKGSYWALTSYDHVVRVGTDNDSFSSKYGVILAQDNEAITERHRALMPFNGSIVTLDNPEHHELRDLVSAAFTPKSIRSLVDSIERIVDRNTDFFVNKLRNGGADVRADFANRIPSMVTCGMMGIPEEDQPWISDIVAYMMGEAHPAHRSGDLIKWVKSTRKLHKYGIQLAEVRLKNPTDDLTSQLLRPVNGIRPLTVEEFVDFFILLVISGVETTAIAVSSAFHYFQEYRDQEDDLRANFDELIDSAIEEIVRHHTPIMHFTRTAIADVEVGGQEIKAGERVCLWYTGANADPNTFDDPLSFNIRRPVKPKHLGFGAPNPHYCLGANLARAEMRAALKAMMERIPQCTLLYDQSVYCPSKWGNGWVSLPAKAT